MSTCSHKLHKFVFSSNSLLPEDGQVNSFVGAYLTKTVFLLYYLNTWSKANTHVHQKSLTTRQRRLTMEKDTCYLTEYFCNHTEYAKMLYFKEFCVTKLTNDQTYKYLLFNPIKTIKCDLSCPNDFTVENGDIVYLSDKVIGELPRTRFLLTFGDVSSERGRQISSDLQADLIYFQKQNGEKFIFKKFYN